MAGADRTPLRRRVSRLSLLALVLVVVAGALCVLAVWIATPSDVAHVVGHLPIAHPDHFPNLSLVIAAVAAAAAFFVVVAALNSAAAIRVLARDRRIPVPLSPEMNRLRSLLLTPLGPAAVRLVGDEEIPATKLPDREAEEGRLHLTVLVPAHDESLTIKATLDSLWAQTRRPDRVVVVADNCTDDTAEIARQNEAEVFTTVGNTEKKAGALNQVLAQMFDDIDALDVVMIMDADSAIVPEFLETALGRMDEDPDLMAVGGVFYGEDGSGLVGQLQRNEYTRYQRYISRRHGKVFVLTGTASLFRAFAMKAVADSRGTLIPGPPGHVYDTLAMTEDNEMTLALKSLGAKMVSPMQCRVTTEVMPDLKALWRQRMRWERGALENIGAYGLTRATARYWFQQIAIGYGTIALNAYFLLMTITFLAADQFVLEPFWVAMGSVFILEKVVTVWAVGWRGRLLAFPLFIELAYDLLLQVIFVKSLVDIATGRSAGWNYVPREAAAEA